MTRLGLVDLVSPLPAAEFVAKHWLPERPFLSAPNPALVGLLREIERLRDVRLLLSARDSPVMVFGREQFRATIPASEAMNFLQHGYALYLSHVEQSVPEAHALLVGICEDLGIAEQDLSLQMFIAEAGAESSIHYDHDVNFQILLEGEKTWSIAPNTHIRNPIAPYHPRRAEGGRIYGFSEEAFARDRRMPREMPADAQRLRATAGSVVFLPRGYWHEVHTLSSSIALNVVVTGASWGAGLARALRHRLLADEDARGYVAGVLSGFDDARASARARFEQVRARAVAALNELTMEEVLVAGVEHHWYWKPAARGRQIVEQDGAHFLVVPGREDDALELEAASVPFLRALVALEHPFAWEHVLALAGPALCAELPAHVVMNLLSSLVEAEWLGR